jgi:hypothetical protein
VNFGQRHEKPGDGDGAISIRIMDVEPAIGVVGWVKGQSQQSSFPSARDTRHGQKSREHATSRAIESSIGAALFYNEQASLVSRGSGEEHRRAQIVYDGLEFETGRSRGSGLCITVAPARSKEASETQAQRYGDDRLSHGCTLNDDLYPIIASGAKSLAPR